MSIHMLEKVLFDIADDPKRAAEFKADPQRFLEPYALHPDEVRIIKELDVREMQARAANPMLVMRAFTCLEGGRDRVPEYMRRLKQPRQ